MDTKSLRNLIDATRNVTAEEIRARLTELDKEERILCAILRAVLRAEGREGREK